MEINIIKFNFTDTEFFQKSWKLREMVFIEEQKVDPSLEFEYEDESLFYLLEIEGKAVAMGRWRETEKGFKLERFVTLKEERGRGYGKYIVQEILSDILPTQKIIYLNAQTQALGFYEKLGFIKEGEPFIEADIEHYLMIYRN
jgi:predicted GNAT family N-acyltransferase